MDGDTAEFELLARVMETIDGFPEDELPVTVFVPDVL